MIEEHLELWLGLIACLVLAVAYVAYAIIAEPSGGHPFGQLMGMIGMSLMVVTELVYSIRKRVRWLHWLGSLRLWLSFHIFTGILGPFLVLLHSAFRFGGLAGVALEMSAVVVLSGFVGRYIYTAVPRTRAGIEIGREELLERAAALRTELDRWIAQKPAIASAISSIEAPQVATGNWRGVLLRTWSDARHNSRVRASLRALEQKEHARLAELDRLFQKQRRLERQIASLEWVQRLMGIWRLIHIPLGITLFTTAVVHIVAAFYYKGLHF